MNDAQLERGRQVHYALFAAARTHGNGDFGDDVLLLTATRRRWVPAGYFG